MPGFSRSAAPSTAIRSPSRSSEKTLRSFDSSDDLLTARLPWSLQYSYNKLQQITNWVYIMNFHISLDRSLKCLPQPRYSLCRQQNYLSLDAFLSLVKLHQNTQDYPARLAIKVTLKDAPHHITSNVPTLSQTTEQIRLISSVSHISSQSLNQDTITADYH